MKDLASRDKKQVVSTRNLFVTALLLLLSSLVFFAASVYMLYFDRVLQSLLSFIIGIILLGSGLAIVREVMEG